VETCPFAKPLLINGFRVFVSRSLLGIRCICYDVHSIAKTDKAEIEVQNVMRPLFHAMLDVSLCALCSLNG
jgi:hypothetical protein